MTNSSADEKLRKRLKLQIMRMKKADNERDTLMSQTIYIGTLGLLFILPVIGGVYLGLWLDEMSAEYSSRWTLGLLVAGLVVGVLNVYLFIRNQA
jgi:ATP synthase protein I